MNRHDYLEGKPRPLYVGCGVKFTEDFCRYIGHLSMPAMRGRIIKISVDNRWIVDWGNTSAHKEPTYEAKENIEYATDVPEDIFSIWGRLVLIDPIEYDRMDRTQSINRLSRP